MAELVATLWLAGLVAGLAYLTAGFFAGIGSGAFSTGAGGGGGSAAGTEIAGAGVAAWATIATGSSTFGAFGAPEPGNKPVSTPMAASEAAVTDTAATASRG